MYTVYHLLFFLVRQFFFRQSTKNKKCRIPITCITMARSRLSCRPLHPPHRTSIIINTDLDCRSSLRHNSGTFRWSSWSLRRSGGSLQRSIVTSKNDWGTLRWPIGSSRNVVGTFLQSVGSSIKAIGTSQQSAGSSIKAIGTSQQSAGTSIKVSGTSQQTAETARAGSWIYLKIYLR